MKEEIRQAKIEELRRLYGDSNRSSQSIYDRIHELESHPVEKLVMPKIAEDKGKETAIKEILNQLKKYLANGSIDFMCVNLEGIEKRLRKALKC